MKDLSSMTYVNYVNLLYIWLLITHKSSFLAHLLIWIKRSLGMQTKMWLKSKLIISWFIFEILPILMKKPNKNLFTVLTGRCKEEDSAVNRKTGKSLKRWRLGWPTSSSTYLLMVRKRWLTLIITLYHSGFTLHSQSVQILSPPNTDISARFRINLRLQT